MCRTCFNAFCTCSERLQREKEIAEERAERRLELLKNLVCTNATEQLEASPALHTAKVKMSF